MKLREALIQQAPSLALQRAAADELARLDAQLRDAVDAIEFALPYVQAMADGYGRPGARLAVERLQRALQTQVTNTVQL